MLAQEVFLLGTAWEALVLGLFSQPLFWNAYFSFYTSLYPPSNVHVQVQLSRLILVLSAHTQSGWGWL